MARRAVLAAPSILSANFSRIGDAIELIISSGGDWVHLDVMDGRFVPNITFGPKMVADIRPLTTLPLDTHLMIEEPQRYFQAFADAGSDHITFHEEAVNDTAAAISDLKRLGAKPGISIKPDTLVRTIEPHLPSLFQVLVMTVHPGFGGQSMIPECVQKVRELDGLRKERGLSFRIAVDGGINARTASVVRDAGADVLVAGSAFFGSADPSNEVLVLKGRHIA